MSVSSAVVDDTVAPSVELSAAQTRRALFALGTGGFVIGTGEFVIMGLLPDAAKDLSISIPQAGHLISIYALGVVIGAPLLAVMGARFPRRAFLISLMLVFALGNFVSAIAPAFSSMALARFLTGFPHGTYFGVAALVAAGLVPLHKRTQAVAMVLLGLTIATLAGVPIAAAIGQLLGWRSAFAIVGAIGSGGIFTVFSYIKPTMMQLAGMPETVVPVVLALFGAGMVSGNLLGSRFADRSMENTIRYVLIWAAVVMTLFTFSAHSAVLGSINVLLVGTVVALGATLQTRLMDVAGDAQTLAAALNHSAFNIANALGAWLGGVAIDAGLGWSSTGWVGGLLAMLGLAVHFWALADMRQRKAV